MRATRKTILAAVAIVLCSAVETPAEVISFNAAKDSYVQLGAATTNFGTNSLLVVKDGGTGTTTMRKTYIQFDISSLLDPLAVADARLEIVGAQNSNVPHTFVVQLFGLNDGVDETWGETTINWNNAPGNTSNTNAFTNAASLGSLTIPSSANGDLVGDLFTYDTSELLSFIRNDTDGRVTLMLRRTDTSTSPNLSFASREDGTYAGPVLILSVVPEPSTVVMLAGLGLVGLLGHLRRRRRS